MAFGAFTTLRTVPSIRFQNIFISLEGSPLLIKPQLPPLPHHCPPFPLASAIGNLLAVSMDLLILDIVT